MSGRGTASGVGYQAVVAAFTGALMLADRPMSRLGSGLIGAPRRVLLETGTGVDDVVIQTDLGVIYVQAKRTISLSDPKADPKPSDSEIASVADQFVRQFRAGNVVDSVRKPLTAAEDRLVLAVSSDTTGPIARNLKDALERRSTHAATEMPAGLTSALATWRQHLEQMWRLASGAAASLEVMDALLDLCRVVVLGEADVALATDILRDAVAVPGDEPGLWSDLNTWAVGAAGTGTGATLSTLRLQLAGKTKLAAPPSYRDDVRTLRTRSDESLNKLARFGFLKTPDGDVVVEREVVDATLVGANGGSLLVTGEPGAGKSAVLHALAGRLARHATVVVLSVDASVNSLDGLRRELGLTHPIGEVFAFASDGRPGFLLVDALDAARGGHADSAYRKLIDVVKELDGWTVVASVRSFDLRLGREFQKAFAGSPVDPRFAEAAFGQVRHIHVPLLTDVEFEDLAAKAPTMGAALDHAGVKLRTLARNAFNLTLLADLLASGVTGPSLAGVRSRGQLLDYYWRERLEDRGVAGEAAISRLVEAMLEARGTDLAAAATDPSWGPELNEAERRGVLVRGGGRRLAFRHHVLFDFAVARQVLSIDSGKALERLARNADGGLLLAPSLGFWLEERLREEPPEAFWRFGQVLLGGSDIDPIAKVEGARLIAELVTEVDTLAPLAAAALREPVATPGAAALQLIGAVLARLSAGFEVPVGAWAAFAELLQPCPDRLIGSVQALVAGLLQADHVPARPILGRAARSLFDVAHASTTLNEHYASVIIPLLAGTYDTDPAETRRRLLSIFEPSRFGRLGFVEGPALARVISSIVKIDPETTAQIYRGIFSAKDFSRDQTTAMGNSYILSLTSNAGQDFDGAKYAMGQAFRAYLDAQPALASAVLADVFEAEAHRDGRSSSERKSKSFDIDGVEHAIEPDWSEVWAWDAGSGEHETWAKMLRDYLAWAQHAPLKDLTTGLSSLIGGSRTALSWRVVLMVLAQRPAELATQGWAIARQPELLRGSGVEQWAIKAISALYPHLTDDEREAYEVSLKDLVLPEASDPVRDGARLAAKVFEAIGKDQLETEGALEHLQTAHEAGVYLGNDPAFNFQVGRRELDRREGINAEGQDLSTGPNSEALDLVEAIEDLLALKDGLNPTQLQELETSVDALKRLFEAHKDAFPEEVGGSIADKLAKGSALLRASHPRDAARSDEWLDLLIDLSRHPMPTSDADVEERFARSPGWGGPAPRVSVARDLSLIVGEPGVWATISETIERLLLEDAHPAVRCVTTSSIINLVNSNVGEAWRLAEAMIAREPNPAVRRALSGALLILGQRDPTRAEPLMLKLLGHRDENLRRNTSLFALLADLAFVHDLPGAQAAIAAWLDDPVENSEFLRALAVQVRDNLAIGYDDPEAAKADGRADTRARSHRFFLTLARAYAPAIQAYLATLGPAPEPVIAAIKMIDFLADELYFAVGAPREGASVSIASLAGRRQFVLDVSELISELTLLGTPHGLHHILQMMGDLVAAAPEETFDLVTAALLRPTGIGRYEHEPLGAPVFVQLVGVFLADHRELLEQPARRGALVDCLAVFVDAGWSEARRLLQSLPELLS